MSGRKHKGIVSPQTLAEPIGSAMARIMGDEDSSRARVEDGTFALSQAAAALHERQLLLGQKPDQESLVQVLYPEFEKGVALCESPIEKAMLGALLGVNYEQGQAIFPKVFDSKQDRVFPESAVVICPQFPFIRFRVDFMVIVTEGQHRGQFVCEADGLDFHDARMDRSRDDLMRSAGVAGIHRVTGRALMGKPNLAMTPLANMVEEWRQSIG